MAMSGFQLQSVKMRGMDPDDPQPFAVLHPNTINENVVKAEYAVRGKLYTAAQERAKSGKKVIYTNVGNPHALGQKPISFFRQVLALVTYPALLEDPMVLSRFPADAVERARLYLQKVPGGTGAYQDSRGNEYIRGEIADFLYRRDGYRGNPSDIFMTDGASQGIALCLLVAIRGRMDGVLTPIPQYPLYSATIEIRNGTSCGYYLDENTGWGLSVDSLRKSVTEARSGGIEPRALVIINPGNPTGQCLDEESMRDIVRFCRKERIVIFADEVYQTNIYETKRDFVSFRKVVLDMGREAEGVEVISFHTVSKGAIGECGRRGAYFECLNIHPAVKDEIYKVMSTNLSSNVDGQIMMGLMVNPPRAGDASFESYNREVDGILGSLERRAKMIADAFNKLDGVTCNPVEGALYCFPQIRIPAKAVEAAQKAGYPADVLYCLELLDETGICCVPGSGFGQEDGTFHLRTTILPPEDQFDEIIQLFTDFHKKFMRKYATRSFL